MKYLIVLMIFASILLADSEQMCVAVTFKASTESQYEKKFCCRLINARHISLETRSFSGWKRYADRNNFTPEEKEEFFKCLRMYFDNQAEPRIGSGI